MKRPQLGRLPAKGVKLPAEGAIEGVDKFIFSRGFYVSHLSLAACEARLDVHNEGRCEKIPASRAKMLLGCWFALETGMLLVLICVGRRREEAESWSGGGGRGVVVWWWGVGAWI